MRITGRFFARWLVLLLLSPCLLIAAIQVRNRETQTSTAGPEATKTGNYWALIIGINDYEEWPSLNTATNDARELESILRNDYGFAQDHIRLRLDGAATLTNLSNDFRQMAAQMGPDDNWLIYYAGHGRLDDLRQDSGYWIPVDGKLSEPSTWIDLAMIRGILISDRVRARSIMVVADSCYAGSLLRGDVPPLDPADRLYQRRLQELRGKTSRQVITSGGTQPVADGGRDGHSLFAYYFLKALRDNTIQYADIEGLYYAQVYTPVLRVSAQRPSIGRMQTLMDDDGQFVIERVNRDAVARMEFVKIQAGEFMMGCSPDDNQCNDVEKPAHRVRISKGFEIGKYEVTQNEWEWVMGANPSYFKGAERPVEQVRWNDVQRFLEKLNARRDGYHYRLPTEAEWEYAARAGTTGPYAGSLSSMGWYGDNTGRQTHVVGIKQPNAWGLYDTHGNVWEWVQDWYGPNYYSVSPLVDPKGPASTPNHTVRGGAWTFDARSARVSNRVTGAPAGGYGIGFRCVREILP